MSSEPVVVARDGPVATVMLARPEARNAVSAAMLERLVAALGDLAVADDVRVVVLGGEGPDAEWQGVRKVCEALTAIEHHPTPVMARVQGAALGAGCQLVTACDLAVAAEDARLGIPSARLGILINFENIQRLVLAVGPKRAAEVLVTGRRLSGVEAAAWGLVNRAVPAAELERATADLAAEVAEAAPLSVRGSKRGIRVVLENLSVDRFTDGHRVADFDMMAAAAFASEDLQEGIRAFRERRRPRFEGR